MRPALWEDAYGAAGYLARCAAAAGKDLCLRRTYADRAMTYLGRAVKGVRNAEQLKKEFPVLQDRADFRRLLTEVENGPKPATPAGLPGG